jgi:hypothetical protein
MLSLYSIELEAAQDEVMGTKHRNDHQEDPARARDSLACLSDSLPHGLELS